MIEAGQPFRKLSAAFILLTTLFVFGSAGCKTREKASTVGNEQVNTEDKSAPDLQQLISDHSFKTRTLSAKASVQAIIGDQENSFNINLRLYTDSVIWISISPLLGIEVARVLVTRDSVK